MSKVSVSGNKRTRYRVYDPGASGGGPPPNADPIASGGTVTISSGTVSHTYTASGVFNVYQAGVLTAVNVTGVGSSGPPSGSIAVGSYAITVGGGGSVVLQYTTAALLAGQYATGGSITVDGNYIRHTIVANSAFALAVPGLLALTDGIVVGGGGGNGGGQSSVKYPAGGAGGEVNVLSATNIVSNQTVTIGTGGADNPAQNGAAGSPGTSTIFGTINTATGGPAGGTGGVGVGGNNADFNGSTSGGLQGGGGGGAGGAASSMDGGQGFEWPPGSGTRYGAGGAGGPSGTTGAGLTGANSGHGADWDDTPGSQSGVVIVRYLPGSFQPGHPLGIPNLYAWYDPLQGVTDAGAGAVSQWNDQSGSGRHLLQSTGTSRPTTGTRTKNGQNVLDFDGGDYFNNLTISIGITNITAIGMFETDVNDNVVGGVLTVHNGSTHDFDNVNSAVLLTRGTNTEYEQAAINSVNVGCGTGGVSPWDVYSAYKSGTSVRVNKGVTSGGVAATTGSGTVTATGTATNLLVGNRWIFSTYGGQCHDGVVGDLILVAAAMAGADLDRTTIWLKIKWGL